MPAYIALLVNTTNETWQPFTTTSLSVPTPTNGTYVVTVGLCGWAPTASRTWQTVTLFRDTSPLGLVLTNLPSLSGSRPFIDPAGYTTRALSSLTWTLVDAKGNTNRGNGAVIGEGRNSSDAFHTTNLFQCVDLALALGTNLVAIRAVDWVGSVAVTNFAYIFDTNGDSTPPSLTLVWPPDGSQVSSDSFAVQAWTDDDTASVALQYTDANGILQTVSGLVERGGNVWVPGVPLPLGTNHLTLIATDAAGNTSTNNFTVVQNSVALTITPISQRFMPYSSAPVSVTVGAQATNVTVNGQPGYSSDGLSWVVENVPLPPGGTVTLQATAQLTDGTLLTASLQEERDPIVFTQMYEFKLDYSDVFDAVGKVVYGSETHHTDFHWERGIGGTNLQACYGQYTTPPLSFSNVTITTWPADTGYLPASAGQQVLLCYTNGLLVSSSTIAWFAEPPVQWMEQSTAKGDLPGDFPVHYSESSKRLIMLFTGGSPLRLRDGLFDLSANLTAEGGVNPNYSQWANMDGSSPFLLQWDIPLPPEQIWLDDQGTLGSDGHLWTVQPDGQEVEITPEAPPTSYNGQLPGWQKHILIITANGTDLAGEMPEFCVGQLVLLGASWTPALPEGTQTSYYWCATGDWLNSWIPSVSKDGSALPEMSPAISTNNPMPAWWYSDRQHIVFCTTTNRFANGQVLAFTGNGDISMYRPIISDFQYSPPSYPTNWFDLGSLCLELGDLNSGGYMKYEVSVWSRYAGRLGIAQLIKRTANDAQLGTRGDFWLDTQNPYGSVPVPSQYETYCPFDDNPGVPDVYPDTTTISDTFIDYVVFRPSAGGQENNIYVTLGIVSGGNPSWAWSATSVPDWVAGTVYWNVQPGWSVTTPTWPDDSNAFPQWLHTLSY